MSASHSVNVNEIAQHFGTKKGAHEFLTVEAQYYLPGLQYTSTAWLREIWTGKMEAAGADL